MTQIHSSYRGRLAPTPSGLLHAGHARTFLAAWRRAREESGTLVFRLEDIDRERCRPEFEVAAREDLAWLGIDWDEGGGREGDFGPYRQSDRGELHRQVWLQLIRDGWVYPADFSRKEILRHQPRRESDGGILFPDALREAHESGQTAEPNPAINWRFRVPDGEIIEFEDGEKGRQSYVAGKDFGDFLVWRKAGGPSYELAVVADDIAMKITEVVRGEDLLLSTARQLLLYRALGALAPGFRHVPLVCDRAGVRLSKTARSVAIRELRDEGWSPAQILAWPDRGDQS